MKPTKPKYKNCFNRLDYLLNELLADLDEDGEATTRKRLRERYRPVEQMEEVFIDCLALLEWRLQGCGIIQSGALQEGGLCVRPEIVRDILQPEVLANLNDFVAMLTGQADQCREILDRYDEFRKNVAAEATARLRKIKPCTSVIQ